MQILKRFAYDFVSLIYPRLCAVCGGHLPLGIPYICIQCDNDLPHTRFLFDNKNPFAHRMTGRVPFNGAISLYTFNRGNGPRQLMHRLKYDNKAWIGEALGKLLAIEMAKSPLLTTIHALVPVPLHPKKEHERGYNQSTAIAKGIQELTGLPILEKILVRTTYSESQTTMGREARLANVSTLYAIENSRQFEQKHLLLIDDVMTTGATLEACAHLMSAVPGCSVSFATVCIAE